MTYFDRKGNEIDLNRFGQLFEDVSYRRVKEDEIGIYTVTTNWIGVDTFYIKKSIKDSILPNIFLTIVSSKEDKDDLNNKIMMSSDESSSLNIHYRILQLCTEKLKNKKKDKK